MNSDQKSQPEADQPMVEKIKNQKNFSTTSACLKLLLSIITLLIFSSCEEKAPISNDKFQKIYVDLLIIQDTTTTSYSLDSMKTIVLKRYNVSQKQYDSMISYYNSNPEEWISFYDSVNVYVERLKFEAGNQP